MRPTVQNSPYLKGPFYRRIIPLPCTQKHTDVTAKAEMKCADQTKLVVRYPTSQLKATKITVHVGLLACCPWRCVMCGCKQTLCGNKWNIRVEFSRDVVFVKLRHQNSPTRIFHSIGTSSICLIACHWLSVVQLYSVNRESVFLSAFKTRLVKAKLHYAVTTRHDTTRLVGNFPADLSATSLTSP